MTSGRSLPSANELLKRYGVSPSKGLGQHFLVDEGILDRIVAASQVSSGDLVLEIGPGLGTLTQRLALRAARVLAVELDRRMLAILKDTLGHEAHVELVEGDILELDPAQLIAPWIGEQADPSLAYHVVANLPYYITSAVIRQLLSARIRPQSMTLMVQREVAQRIVAEPGDLSLLAISVQLFGTPQIVFKVSRGAFAPPPKVDSAVLRVEMRPESLVPDAELERFFAVARAGFGQKRKQIHNSLTHNLPLQRDQVLGGLAAAGIEPNRRAQTLSVAEWAALARALPLESAG